jgi:hypothetical protein
MDCATAGGPCGTDKKTATLKAMAVDGIRDLPLRMRSTTSRALITSPIRNTTEQLDANAHENTHFSTRQIR